MHVLSSSLESYCHMFALLLSGMVKSLTGGYIVKYHPDAVDPDNLGEPLTVDFTPPFKRLQMIPDLEKILGVKFPSATEYNTPGIEKDMLNVNKV